MKCCSEGRWKVTDKGNFIVQIWISVVETVLLDPYCDKSLKFIADTSLCPFRFSRRLRISPSCVWASPATILSDVLRRISSSKEKLFEMPLKRPQSFPKINEFVNSDQYAFAFLFQTFFCLSVIYTAVLFLRLSIFLIISKLYHSFARTNTFYFIPLHVLKLCPHTRN